MSVSRPAEVVDCGPYSSMVQQGTNGDVCLDPRQVCLELFESKARPPCALFFCSGCSKARTQLSEEQRQSESRRRVNQLHQTCRRLRRTSQAFIPGIVLRPPRIPAGHLRSDDDQGVRPRTTDRVPASPKPRKRHLPGSGEVPPSSFCVAVTARLRAVPQELPPD